MVNLQALSDFGKTIRYHLMPFRECPSGVRISELFPGRVMYPFDNFSTLSPQINILFLCQLIFNIAPSIPLNETLK